MKTFESWKQLLVAESNLNRAQLVEDIEALRANLHSLTDRAKSFGLIASSAAVLVAGVAAYQRGKRENTETKPSWLQRVFKVAGLVSTLWLALRSRGSSPKDT